MSQLELFAEPPVVAVTCCELCDARWAVPVGEGETWQPAMLWGYVELAAHRAAVHPAPSVAG